MRWDFGKSGPEQELKLVTTGYRKELKANMKTTLKYSEERLADTEQAVKRGDPTGIFCHKGVFEALDFAFRNSNVLGISKDSREYRQIQRAYWSMPWGLEGQIRAHAKIHSQQQPCNDHTCIKE